MAGKMLMGLAVVLGMFQLVFTVAEPFMGWIEAGQGVHRLLEVTMGRCHDEDQVRPAERDELPVILGHVLDVERGGGLARSFDRGAGDPDDLHLGNVPQAR